MKQHLTNIFLQYDIKLKLSLTNYQTMQTNSNKLYRPNFISGSVKMLLSYYFIYKM